MKCTFAVLGALICVAMAHAAKPEPVTPMKKLPPEQPATVVVTTTTTTTTTTANVVAPAENQKLYGGRPVLITPEQARSVIDRFKAFYPKLGSPRVLIYVNRELVDEESGLKLASRSQSVHESQGSITSDAPASKEVKVDSPGVSVKTTGDGSRTNTYISQQASHDTSYKTQDPRKLSLADRQTMRDVERLFGRPLRMAGTKLADQRLATQMLDGRPISAFDVTADNEQSRKDREALKKVADVVIEVLISSREITAVEVSGDKTYSVPDIHATALRLSDARILGQATAADILGKGSQTADIVRSYGMNDITEVTVFSLMEDMMLESAQQ